MADAEARLLARLGEVTLADLAADFEVRRRSMADAKAAS